MVSRFYICISTIIFCLTNILTSCGQSQDKKNGQVIATKNKSSMMFDTSKIAIIPFDRKDNYPFDSSYNPETLTPQDINIVDSLLIAGVINYNNSSNKGSKENIDFKKYNYRKQLIVVTNKKGEKEVWVNCFCHTWDSDKWKTDILVVMDGGSCYFNFKINLATKMFYDFSVNGEA